MSICEFCDKTLSNRHTLKTHQQTAKYCLKLQNKNISLFKCQGCGKSFNHIHNLNRHTQKCKISNDFLELQNENEKMKEYKEKYLTLLDEYNELKREYKKEIQVLQDKLENVAIELARKPTQSNTTYNRNNNTIIQNLVPITDNYFKDSANNLTIEHLKKGVRGYVEYAMKYPLKDRVLCVDYSRRKIKYKDKDGEIQIDPEMNKISRMFFDSISDKNKELAVECVNKLSDDMDAEQKMNIIADMSQLMVDVTQSAIGHKSDFTHDFVRGVCSESVVS